MQKNLYAVGLLVIICIVALPSFLFAAEPGELNSILDNILTLADIVVEICAVLAIVVFGWGIVKLIASANDPAKLKDAKGIITWGIIGMFILASTYGIIKFIRTYTGITYDPPIEIPKFKI